MIKKEKIAVFISGGGSNAKKIIEHFNEGAGQGTAEVAILVSNTSKAGGLQMAAEKGIPTLVLDKQVFNKTEDLLKILAEHDISFIALAGFLWLVPAYLVRAFPNRIVNIHPALLPKFGGKGMYGMHVHRAVKAAGETESGPTIHYVNEHYDEGAIIFQAKANISKEDEAGDIASKVLALEHQHYPLVIENCLKKLG